jgi:hypothetical protein
MELRQQSLRLIDKESNFLHLEVHESIFLMNGMASEIIS